MIRTFIVRGKAVGKQRTGQKGKTRFTPAKTRAFEAHVRSEYLQQYPLAEMLQGPLAIRITEQRTRPQGHYRKKRGQITTFVYDNAPRYCSTKPDISNIVKSVEDALEGACYKNDAQIAILERCMSVYQDKRHLEGWLEVMVYELEPRGKDNHAEE